MIDLDNPYLLAVLALFTWVWLGYWMKELGR